MSERAIQLLAVAMLAYLAVGIRHAWPAFRAYRSMKRAGTWAWSELTPLVFAITVFTWPLTYWILHHVEKANDQRRNHEA